MPTVQSQMSIAKGLAPGLNAAGQIPGISMLFNTVAKTAAYTVPATESGTIYNTTGNAGSLTFTLPAVATSAGLFYGFVNTVDQTMVITAPASTLVTDGNAAATSATWSTASHKIGGACFVHCDGTKWYLMSTTTGTAAPTIS